MKSILQTKILMIVTAICVVGYIAFGYFFPETALTNAPMMWAAVIRFLS